MTDYVLALILMLAPHRPQAALRPIADAIADVATTRAEARALAAIELHENGFNPQAVHPFGLSCCRRSLRRRVDQEIAEGRATEADRAALRWRFAAQSALRIYEAGRRACGGAEGSFRRYNTGRCLAGAQPATPSDAATWRRGRAYARSMMVTLRRLPREIASR